MASPEFHLKGLDFLKCLCYLAQNLVRLEGGRLARLLFEGKQMRDLEVVEGVCREIGDWMGLEIVDVEFVPGNRGWVLRVTIDKEGGVTVGDCAAFSHQLDPRLDVEDCFPGQVYTLEVSSPGLTRPLKRLRDYTWFKGRKVKIRTSREIEGRKVFKGVLEGEHDGRVTIKNDGGAVTIPYDDIVKANLEFEW